ncbi:MAG: TolC family protein [Pseudomonadales bacterium]|nr:TolC family protein [Pseudomonadales bacterium]
MVTQQDLLTVKFNIAHPTGLLIALITAISLPQWALSAQGDDHQPLATSADLGVDYIFEQALRHSPEYLEIAVRNEEAANYQALGRSWIAGRPNLQMNYVDDSVLDNVGLIELEYGVQLPLWRPGEKRDMSTLGRGYTGQAAAWQDYLRLFVAGRLRSNLAAIDEAQSLLLLAQEATRDAQELLTITRTLFDAGEVSRLEVMRVESLLLNQQKNELQAEAALVDAEREYSVLTGLNIRPDSQYHEVLATQQDVEVSHPQLRFLQSGIDVAEAGIKQVEMLARGSPTLTLGSRRQRDRRQEAYIDSLAISINIPIGGNAFVSSKTSNARRQKVEAEVLFQNTYRELNRQLHEIEHELYLTEQAMPLTLQHQDLSARQWEMAKIAFELGEVALNQVMLALQQAHDSKREVELLKLKKKRLITEFNQGIGVLP